MGAPEDNQPGQEPADHDEERDAHHKEGGLLEGGDLLCLYGACEEQPGCKGRLSDTVVPVPGRAKGHAGIASDLMAGVFSAGATHRRDAVFRCEILARTIKSFERYLLEAVF